MFFNNPVYALFTRLTNHFKHRVTSEKTPESQMVLEITTTVCNYNFCTAATVNDKIAWGTETTSGHFFGGQLLGVFSVVKKDISSLTIRKLC